MNTGAHSAKDIKTSADKDGFTFAYQAAANEDDQLGQLSIAETLISQGFNGLLVSPQTDANLQPAYESAKSKGIAVVNVNDAVMPNAAHYVGNVQKDNGVRVANWFIKHHPKAAKWPLLKASPACMPRRSVPKGSKKRFSQREIQRSRQRSGQLEP